MKNQKINMRDLFDLHFFVSNNVQCMMGGFNEFVGDNAERIYKEDITSDEILCNLYVGFGIGFVLGGMFEVAYVPQNVQRGIEKIKGELIQAGAVPGLVKKAA